MKRLITPLLGTLLVLGAILAAMAAAPVAAVTTCSQILFVADGGSGTGGQSSFCAEDYPLVRNPPTNTGDLSTRHYNNGVGMDNTITSYNWDDSSLPGTRIRLFSGYNFAGTGQYIELVRPSGASPWTNLPSSWNNVVSGYAGCGSTCSDDPS